MDPEALRARTRAAWPCTRDLVFTYRAGDADPHDWQAALPEIEVSPISHAIFATLVPDHTLPPLQPIDGHTYDWGVDSAAVTPAGGLLLADYAMRESLRDGGASRTVYHVVAREDACVTVETGSKAQRKAHPRFVVKLSATAEAIDAVTDAVLELAPTFALGLVERIDSPTRTVHARRPTGAVRAFTEVLACEAHSTAHEFAWIILGMFPAWFDYAPERFAIRPAAYSSVELVFKSPQYPDRGAWIQLSSSRVINCIVRGDGVRENGEMSMHYTPSDDQYAQARTTLLCALRWLFDRSDELPPEVIARIPADRVFPIE